VVGVKVGLEVDEEGQPGRRDLISKGEEERRYPRVLARVLWRRNSGS
jgi:hypothetical protein